MIVQGRPVAAALALSGMVILGGPVLAQETEGEEILLNAIRPFPYDHVLSATHRELIERVNERMEGRLRIEDIGGAEVYPTFDQLEMVMSGQAHLLNSPASYHFERFPEAQAKYLTFGTHPDKQKELIDALDRMAREKLGVAVLGAPSFYRFHIYTTEPVSSLDDLKEMRIRVSPTYLPTLRELEVPTVTMSAGDVYLALDRGVIEGVAWPDFGVIDWGWDEHLRYQIYPALWEEANHILFMHAETLENLPDDVREEFLSIVAEVDADAPEIFNSYGEKEVERLRAAGVEPVVISEEEWWKAQEIYWNQALAELHEIASENADELEQIVRQYYPPDEVYSAPFGRQ